MEMSRATVVYGLALAGLGIGGYVLTDAKSVTSLIPTFFGLPLVILGLVAQRPAARKHAMHFAAVLALLGLFGAAGGLVSLPTLLLGGEVERPAAVISRSVMALLSIVFLVLCIRSFVAARKAREAGNPV
jgi:uncharacterized membrane protein